MKHLIPKDTGGAHVSYEAPILMMIPVVVETGFAGTVGSQTESFDEDEEVEL